MILFIEDEPFFNKSFVEELEVAGFEVVLEADVSKALALFRHKLQDIEIVLLDIMFASPEPLPREINQANILGGRRTGVEILRLMNQDPIGSSIPKIILTNVATEELHRQFSSNNEVVACIRKRDVMPSELVEIVQRILKKGGQ